MSEISTTPSSKLYLSNAWYDGLKFVAQIVLPAIATFYFVLASIWALPYAEQIVGTITAVDALLGALLGLATKQYNESSRYDGALEITTSVNPVDSSITKKLFTLSLESDPNELVNQKTVTFRVVQQ